MHISICKNSSEILWYCPFEKLCLFAFIAEIGNLIWSKSRIRSPPYLYIVGNEVKVEFILALNIIFLFNLSDSRRFSTPTPTWGRGWSRPWSSRRRGRRPRAWRPSPLFLSLHSQASNSRWTSATLNDHQKLNISPNRHLNPSLNYLLLILISNKWVVKYF